MSWNRSSRVVVDRVFRLAGLHGRHRRHVEQHRQRAVLDVRRQRDLPFHHELVDGRFLSRLDHAVRDAVFLRLRDHGRIMRIQDQRPLAFDQFVVRQLGDFFQSIGVVEQHAQVANATDARMEAGGCLAGLQTRKAEDALLALAGEPVEVRLLVGAGRHARPPRAALLLVDQHDAVFAAFVERPGRAGGHAAWIQAVVADARQVEEHQSLDAN